MASRNSLKRLDRVKVLWNHELGPGYFQMGVECHASFEAAVPGQFVMVRLKSQDQPLLSRPFSIHDLIRKKDAVIGFEMLYKVIGTGTAKLSGCRAGDQVDILGPLGKGFSLFRGSGAIYVTAGGIGVAPFVFLAKTLLQSGIEGSGITLFLGGRTVLDLLCRKTFEALGVHVQIATDDGSAGVKGLVSGPLEKAVQKRKPDMLYACGPVPMLRSVMKLSAAHDIRCEVSIETMMACGMGACLGCAVENRRSQNTYMHACLDGPVFDARWINL